MKINKNKIWTKEEVKQVSDKVLENIIKRDKQ
jgi:hypothetical protein